MMHLFFQDDPTLGLKNTANRDLGIDSRANGGWVGIYGPDFSLPLAPIPAWVLQIVKKRVNQIERIKTKFCLYALFIIFHEMSESMDCFD